MDKTSWRCSQGHEWPAAYNRIQQGTGCPVCVKVSADGHRQLAQESGFEWLGTELPPTAMDKTSWRCSQGHEWPAAYNRIQQGTGCPECADQRRIGRSNKRKEPKDYKALAEMRGFEWLGTELPPTTKDKTSWCCSQGHEWTAAYNSIQQGSGCPECVGRSST